MNFSHNFTLPRVVQHKIHTHNTVGRVETLQVKEEDERKKKRDRKSSNGTSNLTNE